MKANGFSATCCGEPLKNPILPIVYLLIPSGHQVDTRKPKRNMAQAERCPIYIHINTNTFIYIGVLFCAYLELLLYFFTLIILYFWYICGLHFVSRRVLYASAGVHLSGRYTINGGHSCQNLPDCGQVVHTAKENYDHHED
jgi:hypothetical protein